MNRVIKFRAWWDDNGKSEPTMFFVGDEYGTIHPYDCLRYAQEGQPVMLMQFTGLLDKNGKEIYEGDIISIWGTILKVYWEKSDASFMAETLDANAMCESGQEWSGSCEVIGNIYENPELLEEN